MVLIHLNLKSVWKKTNDLTTSVTFKTTAKIKKFDIRDWASSKFCMKTFDIKKQSSTQYKSFEQMEMEQVIFEQCFHKLQMLS